MVSARDARYIELFGEEWFKLLDKEFDKEYFIKLADFVKKNREYLKVYPEKDLVFNAFKLCQPSKIKVVLIGQDPYINEKQAHGLAFSISSDCINIPPSLKLISNSIEESLYDGLNLGWDNDLTRWTEQGVFLLNRVLTANAKKSLSHEGKGWEEFTKRVIELISEKCDNVIFLLLGNYAQQVLTYINVSKHFIIMREHPAAALHQQREWNYKDCWNEINNKLTELNKEKIIW